MTGFSMGVTTVYMTVALLWLVPGCGLEVACDDCPVEEATMARWEPQWTQPTDSQKLRAAGALRPQWPHRRRE